LTKRAGWLLDVARALAAAHARNLVHRDIKPENVMVRDDGVVKVLDFGIARKTRASGEGSTAITADANDTADGTVVGTPPYMAREQVGGEPCDGRVDQFAWGVTAFELITGKHPWGGPGVDPVALLAMILTAELPAFATHDVSAPSLEAVVRR